MRNRGLRNRLDDIESGLPASRAACALHGDLCQMGARWPLAGAEVELYYLIRNARIAVGAPVEEPDPYTVNQHRPQSKEEREAGRALLEELKAAVAVDEAEIIVGRD